MSDEKTYNQIDSTTALKVRKQPQPGDVLDSIYRLEQPLGKGGVGVVYKAWHLHLQRPCAIKFLHPQLVSNAELRTRFRREAQSAFQLGHPHIVAITDFRDDPEAWPYLVMELVIGETLRDRLERGPLPPVMAVRLMAQLCDALSTAHRRGVIHRDLKPENLILTRVEAPAPGEMDTALKVLDFGLSKLLDGAEITGNGRLLGSPSYMSPEQARGDSHLVDARSDVFAVGALLYESLTGDKLFSADNFEQKRQMIIAARLPPLKLMERGLPPQLEKIISKACARLPEDRYQTATRLMDALINVYPSGPRIDTTVPPVVAPRPLAIEPPPAATPAKAPTLDATSTGSSVGGGELIPGVPGGVTSPVAVPGAASPPKRSPMRPAMLVAGLLAVAVVGVGGYSIWSANGTPTAGAGPSLGGKEPSRDPVGPHATPLENPTAGSPADRPEIPEHLGKLTIKPTRPAVGPTPPVDPRLAMGQNKWKKNWKPGIKPLVPAQPAPGSAAAVRPATTTGPVPPPAGDTSSTEKAVPSVNVIMRTKAVPAILRCYPAGSAGPGKFSVDMTVGADGRVTEANVEGAEDQASCVLGILRALHFAPPTDGDSYSFRYDFAGVRH
jgi:serine/threonine-protein kinase